MSMDTANFSSGVLLAATNAFDSLALFEQYEPDGDQRSGDCGQDVIENLYLVPG